MEGDVVGIDTYDLVLVKPVSMLTPKEKELRQKRYGKNSGLPQPILKPEPAPVVAKQSTPQQPAPQPKPLYEYEGEQVMAPVPSGGGSAMVGVKKKDGTIEYIKPELDIPIIDDINCTKGQAIADPYGFESIFFIIQHFPPNSVVFFFRLSSSSSSVVFTLGSNTLNHSVVPISIYFLLVVVSIL